MARRWQPPKQSKSDDRAGPEWSRVLSGMERQAFLAAIQAEMQRRKILAQIFDGYLDGLMPDGTAVKCGFSSLAVACGAARLADYPAVVRAHFDRVLPAVPERAAPPLTFEGLAPRLVAHLYTDEQLRGSKARPITRPLAPGLSAVLAVDFGNAIASLAPESVAHLTQTHDELMAIGVENVGRHRCERDDLTLPGGQRAFALSTREPTAASQVLHLAGHLGTPHPAGALVSFPTRNMLLCLPLQAGAGRATAAALRGFVQVVGGVFADAKKNQRRVFSDQFYWWRGETIEPFSASMGPKGAIIAPPRAFADLLLAGAGPAS